ncbi:hypothetical protein CTAYLR_008321 [Chrysophaeum taylorii]|uniref:Uncharacterized protein n=1 Tax=Chrysophaeum taylorii TaxID=2483200 RepID=A0AAD7UBN4_9STRA|nr:hypothetical protein CTAYLR_008321 [Chrysophaeum taylorii]
MLFVVPIVSALVVVPLKRSPSVGRVARSRAPPPHKVSVVRRQTAVRSSSVSSSSSESYRLYASRWGQLGMLSLLALISDWVCFATAAVPSEFKAATGMSSASLIDLFLASNVVSCFLYTDVSRVLGLRKSTVLAAGLMAAGCALRAGLFADRGATILGTALVGVAQPFFQCAPPLLSAVWFSSTERSLATATALNANQLGIAAAFVVGGLMRSDLELYFGTICVASVLALGLAAAFCRDKPPTPPTASAAAKTLANRRPELTFHKSLSTLLDSDNFLAALAAFVASIGVTNVVSAFAGDALDRAGCGSAHVASIGAAFQVAIVLGGVGLGAYVDKTKSYKDTTLACLGTALGLVALLGVACGYDRQLPATLVVTAILALGAVVGPVQPINAELAVEVSHPFDENAVEAAQQLAGNLASALLVPAYQAARLFDLEVEPSKHLLSGDHFGFSAHFHHPRFGLLLPEPSFLPPTDVRGDTLLLTLLLAITFVYFKGADFDLKRSALDDDL